MSDRKLEDGEHDKPHSLEMAFLWRRMIGQMFDQGVPRYPKGLSSEEVLNAYRDAHIYLLRSDVPLSPYMRNRIANVWEHYPHRTARQKREWRATYDHVLIEYWTLLLKHQKGVPHRKAVAMAKKEWACIQGVKVRSLYKRGTRQRKPSSRKK